MGIFTKSPDLRISTDFAESLYNLSDTELQAGEDFITLLRHSEVGPVCLLAYDIKKVLIAEKVRRSLIDARIQVALKQQKESTTEEEKK